jgi:L-ascorbate metabolism protein UlaG (beta-lactamase superfamily)
MMGAAKVKWLGHASFQITSANGKNILIDPWLEGNPSSTVSVADIGDVDIIVVTHDHFDHLGQAVDIAKATGALVVGMVETMGKLQNEMGVPPEQVVNGGFGMNIGGTSEVDGIKFTMTQAFHSSETGSACGFVITLEDGKTIYHAGDTGIFGTMATIGELYPLDLALLPIGSIFTMDPLQAAHALTLLKPKAVVPMHYQTFPILEQGPENFAELAKEKAPDVEVVALKPGEEHTLA